MATIKPGSAFAADYRPVVNTAGIRKSQDLSTGASAARTLGLTSVYAETVSAGNATAMSRKQYQKTLTPEAKAFMKRAKGGRK